MAEEGKGVALAILGIVAVIAVVGLVLLFTGATGKISAPFEKVYGGANRYEESPYLVDRTTGGFLSTPGTADYLPEGYQGSEVSGTLQEEQDAGRYGFPAERTTYNRQPYYTPSGQNDPCGACPKVRLADGRVEQSVCIPDPVQAEAQGGESVGNGCYVLGTSV